MVNINTEAVLTTLPRLAASLPLRCLVILDFNTALCSPCGLATAIGHISVITLLSWLHNAILVASRPIRLLTALLFAPLLCWSLCLAQLTPACGVASMPIHPGCHRPFLHSVFRRSVADACRGLPLCFLFDFCFSIPRSLTLDRRCFSISSLRPSSLSGPSPCILPAGAYWLPMPLGLHWASSSARFSYFWWKVADSDRQLIPGFSGNHRCCGRMS